MLETLKGIIMKNSIHNHLNKINKISYEVKKC